MTLMAFGAGWKMKKHGLCMGLKPRMRGDSLPGNELPGYAYQDMIPSSPLPPAGTSLMGEEF